jgi:hypothetical protein
VNGRERRATARHEAGHAVAAFAMGAEGLAVRWAPRPGVVAATEYSGTSIGGEREAAVIVAGALAEGSLDGASADLARVAELVRDGARLDVCLVWAQALVAILQPEIAVVADEVAWRGALDHAGIRAAIEGARRPPAPDLAMQTRAILNSGVPRIAPPARRHPGYRAGADRAARPVRGQAARMRVVELPERLRPLPPPKRPAS